MKTSKKSPRTYLLLWDEYQDCIMVETMLRFMGDQSDDLQMRLDKLQKRICKRDPKMQKRWEKINKTHKRYVRMHMKRYRTTDAPAFYCKDHANSLKDPCKSQCFDCVATVGERKIETKNLNK